MKKKTAVNIVHFVRGQDARFDSRELCDTYLSELRLAREYPMPYTILLQYDALIRPEYVNPLLEQDDPNREIGVWLEFCKELIANDVGLPWHGREGYDWDWYVDPDMTVAYSVPDRLRILDAIMEKFRSVFGYYPKSVGSWLFDAVTMDYLVTKYGVTAFCNCKEQVGTDGYTLWGGYYNGGYYPSKKNILSPAQTKGEQIGAPLFRMLGVDPIRQYESGLDERWNPAKMQKVFTMEPACACGKDPAFIDWYFSECLCSAPLSFANVQLGQENSFLWRWMKEGWELQTKKIWEGWRAGLFDVETLAETADHFKSTYSETPATATVALRDFENTGKQSVWYNCKNYRVNWYRDDAWFGIRDAFLFDETYPERYLTETATGNYAEYDTLPLLDGYHWGGDGVRAFAEITHLDGTPVRNAKILSVTDEDPTLVLSATADGAPLTITCREDGVEITPGADGLALRFTYRDTGDTALFPSRSGIDYTHRSHRYSLAASKSPVCPAPRTVLFPLDGSLLLSANRQK